MYKQFISALALVAVSACSGATGPDAGASEGDLMCAALINAATVLHEDGKIEFYGGMDKEVLGPQTAFLTRHTKSENLDPQAAIGLMKLQRIKLMKDTPADEIRTRALACL